MEEGTSFEILPGTIRGIKFGLATKQEIVKSSINEFPINHPSQLLNPFLGLPLEAGKCESCGTAEPGQCEGHFGYIELPIPIYHPDHVSELKRMLSLLCLKCLKLKNRKFQVKHIGVLERMLSSCCEEVSQISVNEVKNSDGACYLELKLPKNANLDDGFWSFLERYGYRYGDGYSRRLLPYEAMEILKRIPEDTRRKLSAKGYYPQAGYILEFLPVPPNCLSVPDISDGMNIMSSDHSITMLRKVLKQIENIKSSRSGTPNFESHEVEANDLQVAVAQYLEFRGTGKASRDVDKRYGVGKESNDTTTKAWLEKMKTLFIRKGSGFSSRSVITGDPFKGVDEIGLPFEVAQRITFEERVSLHNVAYLQKLVDEKLCLTYKDGSSTYSLREGSKGHTFLRPGQLVHRRIMDGDIVFINRPPTTHKHSLQALSVYVHDDHTVKINPLICGPLSADFDGDCIHLFYPQSLAAKAEVLEFFSVEKQLLSSHTGNFNLQMGCDSLLAFKLMFENYFFSKACAQQLAMFLPSTLPKPALVKSHISVPHWTTFQILETALPKCFDCLGDRYEVNKSEVLRIDYSKDTVSSILNDIVSSIYFSKGPKEVIEFFNALQPMLMEYLYKEGFSISLGDFFISKAAIEKIQGSIQGESKLLNNLRSSYNQYVELQLERLLRAEKIPVTAFALHSSAIGHLIDPKSESALNKVVQQIGFLGLQMSDRGKFYSKTLVKDMTLLFRNKYPSAGHYPSEEYGVVSSCLFNGLDPYQEMVHSISSREVIVRSTRGLTEPGTLFKNLMAILRDVVICYDGTVRNVCSNSIIQFEYGVNNESKFQSEFGAGEPVGVLAATAMSNPAYKAVLDSSPSSNSSWEMMKEILLCGASFKNDLSDRRVILYLNDCGCGRKYCRERAAYQVNNHLRKVCLKDAAVEFLIEYGIQQTTYEVLGVGAYLVGHIHLNKKQLDDQGLDLNEILERCQDKVYSLRRKKKIALLFRRIDLSVSASCCFNQGKSTSREMPCLRFSWPIDSSDDHLEQTAHLLADTICPVLLETVIKGDHRVSSASIIWSSPETMTWIKSSSKSHPGELAVEVTLEKEAVKQSGDAWRIVMDSCLPLIHLIDTKRSIPYAIKQVQEMLGISCAFEQAVQRLSTSVTMVTKGVLKDHLLLLANTMTCAGSLVGFNAGGIKALSRSLNVQIPFAEATLFTPRKCFERAAEKCHVDSLSSVVASCSWGKHVSVGTGSSFDILLDTRKVELNQQEGQNVYDFLLLMRSSHAQEEKGTDCLGAEIDDLLPEDEDMNLYLSPERDSDTMKPTFEDGVEDLNENVDEGKSSGGGWDKVSNNTSNTGGGGWDLADKNPTPAKSSADQSDSWSSWGGKKVEEESPGWGKKVDSDGLSQPATGSWGKATQSNSAKVSTDTPNADGGGWDLFDKNPTTAKSCNDQSDSWSSWGGKKVEEGSHGGWGKKVDSDGFSQPATGSWGKATQSSSKISESGKVPDQSGSQSSWGKAFGESGKSLDQPSDNHKQSDQWSSWGKTVKDDVKVTSSSSGDWNQTTEGKLSTSSGWNKPESSKGLVQSAWGKNSNESKGGAYLSSNVHKRADSSPAWGKSPKEDGGQKSGREWSAWKKGNEDARLVSPTANASIETAQGDRSSALDWGESGPRSPEGSWSKKGILGEQPKEAASGWASSKGVSGDWDNVVPRSPTAQKTESQNNTWNSRGVVNERSNDSAGGWGSPKVATSDGTQSQWGVQKSTVKVDSNQSPRGWGSAGSENEKLNEATGVAGGWGSSKGSGDWGTAVPRSPAALREESPHNTWSCTTAADERGNESAGGWGSPKVGSSEGHGWGSPKVGSGEGHAWGSPKVGSSEGHGQSPWGPRKRKGGDGNESSRAWGSAGSGSGDWKNKRNRPAKPADDSGTGVAFTSTRQRLDRFTAEEQDILLEVELIMQNIRRIMHQSGLNDGDPLSADDQSYIVNNVVNHHPDKAAKIGAGIDYLMISKHSSFQDTRCFYVVSTDGAKQDFSYRKCLENFIRNKFPDKGDGFNQKYFAKKLPPLPRPGWKREQNAAPEEAAAGWRREQNAAPEEAAAGWRREQNSAPEEAAAAAATEEPKQPSAATEETMTAET
nr:DNA-directed RNA polymerase V subunit 1 [Ipomoea batatas]